MPLLQHLAEGSLQVKTITIKIIKLLYIINMKTKEDIKNKPGTLKQHRQTASGTLKQHQTAHKLFTFQAQVPTKVDETSLCDPEENDRNACKTGCTLAASAKLVITFELTV